MQSLPDCNARHLVRCLLQLVGEFPEDSPVCGGVHEARFSIGLTSNRCEGGLHDDCLPLRRTTQPKGTNHRVKPEASLPSAHWSSLSSYSHRNCQFFVSPYVLAQRSSS